MSDQDRDDPKIWRTTRAARIGAACLAVVVGGTVLIVGVGILVDSSIAGGLVIAVVALALIGAFLLMAFRPRIVIDAGQLTIVNPTKTYRVALRDVVEVKPGYWGLIVVVNGEFLS